MEHDQFEELHRGLTGFGIVLSLVDMVNCGINGIDVRFTRAGRRFRDSESPDIERINTELSKGFGRLLAYPGFSCLASEYVDGTLLVEVRRVIRFDTLNNFESCL